MHRREFLKALAAVPVLAKLLPKEDLTVKEIVKASSDADTCLTTSTPSVVMSSEDKIYLLEPNKTPLSLLLEEQEKQRGPDFEWLEEFPY